MGDKQRAKAIQDMLNRGPGDYPAPPRAYWSDESRPSHPAWRRRLFAALIIAAIVLAVSGMPGFEG